MTDASRRALEGLRDFRTLDWTVIPILSIVFYIYVSEIRRARETGRWEVVYAGITLFGMDFLNETLNGWILNWTGRSALWTAPGATSLRTMVGWNIEIMFMFAISGIIFWSTLSKNPNRRIFGIAEKWWVAAGYSAFCVFIEWFLNRGGLLVWEYRFWNRSFEGVWLIFLFGYFHFYVGVILVNRLRSHRARLSAVGCIYGLAIALNVIGACWLGYRY